MKRIGLLALATALGLSSSTVFAAESFDELTMKILRNAPVWEDVWRTWNSCIAYQLDTTVKYAPYSQKLHNFDWAFIECNKQIEQDYYAEAMRIPGVAAIFEQKTDGIKDGLRTKLKFIILGCDDQCQAIYGMMARATS